MMKPKIRAPRRKINNNADEVEECWNLLRDSLVDIHNRDAGRLAFEQLYRASYKIVLKKRGNELYTRVRDFEERWFVEKVMPRVNQLITKSLVSIALSEVPGITAHERRQMGERFLKGIREHWDDHNLCMNMIADILMYLDRSYTQETGQPSIFTTTIGLFRDNVLRGHPPVGVEDNASFTIIDLLNHVLLDQITMEREGDAIDKSLVKACVQMLETLYESDAEKEHEKLYLTIFEPYFIGESEKFYAKERQRFLQDGDTSAWLRHTSRRLTEERARCQSSLAKSTEASIIKVVQQELISANLDEFLNFESTGLRSMIDNDREQDLAILYQLIVQVDPSLSALRTILQKRVVELGMEIEKVLKESEAAQTLDAHGGGNGAKKARSAQTKAQQQTASAIKWVDDVLALKDKFDRLHRECFRGDISIETTLTKSFSDFINLFARASEFVSLFLDYNFRRKDIEEDTELIMRKAVTLIQYLRDKDMFERYFQKHLARRLLHGKAASHDIEKAMISRMKQEVGNHFTSKFEGMFKDMNISTDLSSQYHSYIENLGEPEVKGVQLGIKVLTSNNWPPEVMGRSSAMDGPKIECKYPANITRLQQSFFKFYLKNRSGRKLTWVGSAGTADMRCTFPKMPGGKSTLARDRRYELTISTYGMVVLMLFSDRPDGTSISYSEIEAETNIPEPDLRRVLVTLTASKTCNVLVNESGRFDIEPETKFHINLAFESKTIKIRVPNVTSTSKVEDRDERKETENKTEQTRKYIIDAAVVRIMKQRKELTHTQLMNEVIEHLSSRFVAGVGMIKQRIEDLIGREYLERVEDDNQGRSAYRYLA